MIVVISAAGTLLIFGFEKLYLGPLRARAAAGA